MFSSINRPCGVGKVTPVSSVSKYQPMMTEVGITRSLENVLFGD